MELPLAEVRNASEETAWVWWEGGSVLDMLDVREGALSNFSA